MLNKNFLLYISAFLVFLTLTIFITYPLIFHLGDFSVGIGDEFVITWIQNWVIHALSNNPLKLFNANLYYPYNLTLAYSDLLLTTSIVAIVPLKIIGQPIATFNFTLISSFIFLGFSIFLLCFYLTRNFLASILGGILVIMSPFTLDKTTHLQILSVEFVPLAILFFLIFIQEQKIKYLAISLFFFVIQTYNSFMPGYFILFSYAVIFTYFLFYQQKKAKKLINKRTLSLFITSLALVVFVSIPYFLVSKEFEYTRNIRDAIHFALQPEDLLYPSIHTKLHDVLISLPINQVSQNNEFKPGYLGFVFTLLILFSTWYIIKNLKKKNFILNSFFITSLVGLVLSLGPALHLGRQTLHIPFPIPLPYALAYYVLPGFAGFRNSARFEMLFVICIAVVVAYVLHQILLNESKRAQLFIYLTLILGCILEFNFPYTYVRVVQKQNFPKVFEWLNKTPNDSSSLIMPAYNWNSQYAPDEMLRNYYSTANFRRTVNGYSGFFPPAWQENLTYLTNNFPSNESIKKIKKQGVDYIIIDRAGYDKNFNNKNLKYDGDTIVEKLGQNTSVQLIEDFGDYVVFKIN